MKQNKNHNKNTHKNALKVSEKEEEKKTRHSAFITIPPSTSLPPTADDKNKRKKQRLKAFIAEYSKNKGE